MVKMVNFVLCMFYHNKKNTAFVAAAGTINNNNDNYTGSNKWCCTAYLTQIISCNPPKNPK